MTKDDPVQREQYVQITAEQIAKAFLNIRPSGRTGLNDLNSGAAEGARLRAVATLLPKTKKCGHCKIRLDVDRQGDPMNVQAVSCSDDF